MSHLTLIQIPFSHNCVKVRVALDLKRLPYKTKDIPPMDRASVVAASGQGLVPVLVDDGRAIADSTAILLHLETSYPDTPLVPKDPALRAECLILEDWADHAFMALSRRIAYGTILTRPALLAARFFPNDGAASRWLKQRIAKRVVTRRFGLSPARHARDLLEAKRLAVLAVSRLGGRRWLVGEAPTIADVALATMSAPLAVDASLRDDPAVRDLVAWGAPLLPTDIRTLYRG
jgi:glutathione S-transferase